MATEAILHPDESVTFHHSFENLASCLRVFRNKALCKCYGYSQSEYLLRRGRGGLLPGAFAFHKHITVPVFPWTSCCAGPRDLNRKHPLSWLTPVKLWGSFFNSSAWDKGSRNPDEHLRERDPCGVGWGEEGSPKQKTNLPTCQVFPLRNQECKRFLSNQGPFPKAGSAPSLVPLCSSVDFLKFSWIGIAFQQFYVVLDNIL